MRCPTFLSIGTIGVGKTSFINGLHLLYEHGNLLEESDNCTELYKRFHEDKVIREKKSQEIKETTIEFIKLNNTLGINFIDFPGILFSDVNSLDDPWALEFINKIKDCRGICGIFWFISDGDSTETDQFMLKIFRVRCLLDKGLISNVYLLLSNSPYEGSQDKYVRVLNSEGIQVKESFCYDLKFFNYPIRPLLRKKSANSILEFKTMVNDRFIPYFENKIIRIDPDPSFIYNQFNENTKTFQDKVRIIAKRFIEKEVIRNLNTEYVVDLSDDDTNILLHKYKLIERDFEHYDFSNKLQSYFLYEWREFTHSSGVGNMATQRDEIKYLFSKNICNFDKSTIEIGITVLVDLPENKEKESPGFFNGYLKIGIITVVIFGIVFVVKRFYFM